LKIIKILKLAVYNFENAELLIIIALWSIIEQSFNSSWDLVLKEETKNIISNTGVNIYSNLFKYNKPSKWKFKQYKRCI